MGREHGAFDLRIGEPVMVQIIVRLLAINSCLLAVIGAVRQENPLDLIVLLGLGVLNVVGFVTAAILCCDDQADGLYSLLTNTVPFLLVLWTMASVVLLRIDIRRAHDPRQRN